MTHIPLLQNQKTQHFYLEEQTLTGTREKKPQCDHCKRSGHTMESCQKLHGKPPHWKKKGGGRAFHASNDVQDHQSSLGELPFTKEQIDTLVKLLQSSDSSIQTPSSCSLAQSGNYLHAALVSVHSSRSWIVDSGSTDHMTGSANLFVSYSPCAGNTKNQTCRWLSFCYCRKGFYIHISFPYSS